MNKKERHDHLMRLADGIEARFDEMVVAESLDNGKPEWLAKQVDIPRASENLRFFATAFYTFPHKCMIWTAKLSIIQRVNP